MRLDTLPTSGPEPHLSNYVTFGHGGSDCVIFRNPALGIEKTIVGERGVMEGFPGIVYESCWTNALTRAEKTVEPRVRYRTAFEPRAEGRYIVLWQIQPDGRYWGDDGFGMEDDEEIVLYTYLDDHGDFTGPFRAYRVGKREFCRER